MAKNHSHLFAHGSTGYQFDKGLPCGHSHVAAWLGLGGLRWPHHVSDDWCWLSAESHFPNKLLWTFYHGGYVPKVARKKTSPLVQDYAWVILANVPLTKASHMAKPRFNVGGADTRLRI